jgi:hypothetical protein
MDMLIAVGFGIALVTKDGEVVYDERNCKGQYQCPICDGTGYSVGIEEFDNELCYLCHGAQLSDFWTTQDAENAALKDPDHDWRIIKHGPLYGVTYQRQDVGLWVLVDKNIGFA